MYVGLKLIRMLVYEQEKSGEIQLLMNCAQWLLLSSGVFFGGENLYLSFTLYTLY